jgi:hypothetical protein
VVSVTESAGYIWAELTRRATRGVAAYTCVHVVCVHADSVHLQVLTMSDFDRCTAILRQLGFPGGVGHSSSGSGRTI